MALQQLESIDHSALDPYRELDRSNRTRNDKFFVGEGRLVVERMLASDCQIVSVVLGDHVEESIRKRVPDSAELLLLPKKEISKLVGFDFHSGILACARRKRLTVLDHESDKCNFLRKPQSTVVVCPFTVLPDNLGSIMRLSAGFGVDAVIVGHRSADPFSRRAIRVSMGNVFQMPIIEPDSTMAALSQLKNQLGFCLIAATGTKKARQLPIDRPDERTAIVFGNEARGLDQEMIDLCDMQVSIPMSGTTDSLNVANSAAIVLYKFTRTG